MVSDDPFPVTTTAAAAAVIDTPVSVIVEQAESNRAPVDLDPLDVLDGLRVIWADDLDGEVLLLQCRGIVLADSSLTLRGVAASVAAAAPHQSRLQAVPDGPPAF